MQVFKSVTQGTCIYHFTKAPPSDEPIRISIGNNSATIASPEFAPITPAVIEALYPDVRCFPLIRRASVSLLERLAQDEAVRPLSEYADSITQGDLNLSTHRRQYSYDPTPVRLLRGRHVGRYIVNYDASTEYCAEGFRENYVARNRRNAYLLSQQVTGTTDVRRLHFGIAEDAPTDYLCGHSLNKTLLMDGTCNRVLLGLLNSKLMDWVFRTTSSNNNVQGYELAQLPVHDLTDSHRADLESIVDRILEAKLARPSADTTALEAQIDRLVYDLYGLTEEEIAAVEARVGPTT